MSEQQSLDGRTIYLPQMSYGGARCVAAAFKSVGLHAEPVPDSDSETLEVGSRFTSGDECYPERITLGDFVKLVHAPGADPKKIAFFMPTAGGPCRFGQYEGYMKKVMHQLGHDDVIVFSPSSQNNYQGIGDNSFVRTAWRALVVSDLLHKLLLKTRPYETHPGDADEVYAKGLDEACQALACKADHAERLQGLVAALTRSRDRFRAVPVSRSERRPLIGIIGEIFCRLHTFSNENLIRKLEQHGGEAWVSDLSEWIWYTGAEQKQNLILTGRRFSKPMLANLIRNHVQKRDEHAMLAPLKEDLKGYEEPEDIREILDYSEPYLPSYGALGEMVLNIGKTIYLHKKGAHGVIDISPFTCMNGIISEAIYPHVSRDYDGIPIRNFYFDGTAIDLDRDLGIFIELARNYQHKKAGKE